MKVITKNVDEYGNFTTLPRIDSENGSLKLDSPDATHQIELIFNDLKDIDLFIGAMEILRRNGKFTKH